MANKRSYGVTLVGGSSLLVIFALLCLTVFTVLALSTVEAGGRLSRKSAEAVTAYYAADARAEEILARLRSGEIPAGASQKDELVHYFVTLDEGQDLAVVLRLGLGDYEVLRWQVRPTSPWVPDESLALWDGTAS